MAEEGGSELEEEIECSPQPDSTYTAPQATLNGSAHPEPEPTPPTQTTPAPTHIVPSQVC